MALLLVVIYITFISLGLPDSIFGVSWPLVHLEMGVSQGFGSVYSVIVALTSGGVSFFAGFFINKFGTGKVTAFSVLLTAVSLLGVAHSPNIVVMLMFSILGGLGAGAIDTGLNNFISLHYKAIHMNFLHCFWGVGVSASPLIMAFFLQNGNWRGGYSTVSYIQFSITIIVFLSLFLWKKYDIKPQHTTLKNSGKQSFKIMEILQTKGVICCILSLGLYCCMESVLGVWGSTFLISTRSFTADRASLFIALYYGGIMLGRFVSGLLSLKLCDKTLIRLGIFLSLGGIILLFVPNEVCSILGLIITGVGFGPIFPSIMHVVPNFFGVEKSTYITGYLMGGAYLIGFLSQVIFGYTASNTTFNITPYCLLCCSVAVFAFFELANKKALKGA